MSKAQEINNAITNEEAEAMGPAAGLPGVRFNLTKRIQIAEAQADEQAEEKVKNWYRGQAAGFRDSLDVLEEMERTGEPCRAFVEELARSYDCMNRARQPLDCNQLPGFSKTLWCPACKACALLQDED